MLIIRETKSGGDYSGLDPIFYATKRMPVTTRWFVIRDGRLVDSFMQLGRARRAYPGAEVQRSTLQAYRNPSASEAQR